MKPACADVGDVTVPLTFRCLGDGLPLDQVRPLIKVFDWYGSWVGLFVWWQFLRGFPGWCSCLRTQGGIVGPGFSTKIHQECSHDAQ